MGPKKRKQFDDIFGKRTVRFTRTRCYSDYPGLVQRVTPYTIIASDDNSVVLKWHDEDDYEWMQQYVFEGKNRMHTISYWNIEFYRRVRT